MALWLRGPAHISNATWSRQQAVLRAVLDADFQCYGIGCKSIPLALREVQALGFEVSSKQRRMDNDKCDRR
jgi:hypothetical protein